MLKRGNLRESDFEEASLNTISFDPSTIAALCFSVASCVSSLASFPGHCEPAGLLVCRQSSRAEVVSYSAPDLMAVDLVVFMPQPVPDAPDVRPRLVWC